jgi:anti-sigma regulatory factor (Ser/Thr protein kinase)
VRDDRAIFTGHFPPEPASVRRARRVLRLVSASVSRDLFECLEMVVSELATNAVVHARTPFEVSLRLRPTVRVEVTDLNPAVPVLRSVGRDQVGGRGLVVVTACTEDWGYEVKPSGGKTVWADLGVAWDAATR